MANVMLALTGVICILFVLLDREKDAFEAYKQAENEKILRLTLDADKLTAANALAAQKYSTDLADLEKTYEDTLSRINLEHSGRLRNLEARSDRYRRMSQNSSSECRNLGDITAKLDTALEKGRQLVVELRERVILREQQIEIIGKQLAADRHLLEQVQ